MDMQGGHLVQVPAQLETAKFDAIDETLKIYKICRGPKDWTNPNDAGMDQKVQGELAARLKGQKL